MAQSPTRTLLAGAALGFAASAVLPLIVGLTDRPQETTLLATLAAVLCLLSAFMWPRAERSAPAASVESASPAPPEPAPAAAEIDIEALADPMLLIEGLTVRRTNAAARALLGERIVGADVRVALRHPAILEALAQSRELGRPAVRELMGLGRPENIIRLRAVAQDGRALLSLTDVTQTRLTERMRVDFVANASHELRTPLTTLLGFIETLQGPAADDEPARRRFLDIMAREANRMSRLIDDLLSLSRIELDKYVQPRTPIDLAPVLADVARTLAVRLEADSRELRPDVPDQLPQVVADRDQILQVLHNLISNALKYGHTGSPIHVSAEALPARPPKGEAMVRVSVRDEGEGIEAEHLPRLTERFYRINTGRSRKMGGTGLGLAIVKHIVERHRGQLAIESTPGVGTTVSFTLPQVREETAVNDMADRDAAQLALSPQ